MILKYEADLLKNLFLCLSTRKTREIVTYRYYIRHGIYSVWPHKHPQFMLESHCSLVLLFPLSLSVVSKVLEWGNVETGRRVLTSCLKSSCLYKQPSISQPLPRQNKYVFMYFHFTYSFWGRQCTSPYCCSAFEDILGVTGVESLGSGASRDNSVSRFLSAEGSHVKLCNLLAQLLSQMNWLAQQTILVPIYLPWHSQGSTWTWLESLVNICLSRNGPEQREWVGLRSQWTQNPLSISDRWGGGCWTSALATLLPVCAGFLMICYVLSPLFPDQDLASAHSGTSRHHS